MKQRLALLLTLLAAALLCACGEKADDQRWLWSSEEITPPADFGYVLTVASTENEVFAISHTALGRYEDGGITLLDTIYSADAPAMVYGASGYGDTLYLLAGEMRPQYTEYGEPRENPDFSGKYTVIAYRNGARTEATPFQLSENDVLSGLLALSDEYMLCWTATDAWVVSLAESGSVYPQQVSGEIVAPTTSRSGMWLWAKQDETFGFYPLTAAENALGDLVQPENCPTSVATTISENNGCLLNTNGTLALYQPSLQAFAHLVDWHDCKLSHIDVTDIVQRSSDSWLCASSVDNGLWYVTRHPVESSRKTLRIAAAFHTGELDDLVKQFNATHEDYIAEVDYYPENAYDRLCTEIMAGNGPDVLNLFGLSLPLDSSYLENLYPYIDADDELDRSTFVPAVLSSLEVRGVLRSIPATYEVTTLTAKASDVGNTTTHWTFDEMRSILKGHGNNVHLLHESWTSMELLKWIASISTGTFIDWENHSAHYNDNAFYEYLRFCSELPFQQQVTSDDQSWPYIARLDSIQNFGRLQWISENYSEPFTFIGFPAENGSGSFFACSTLHLGISSDSDKKELAWEFLKTALSSIYQEELANSLYVPVRKDIMESRLQKEVASKIVQEQYLQMVSQPLVFIGYNEEISEIILEEGEAYFSGQRTAEEAAERIQNRVTLYLSEIE